MTHGESREIRAPIRPPGYTSWGELIVIGQHAVGSHFRSTPKLVFNAPEHELANRLLVCKDTLCRSFRLSPDAKKGVQHTQAFFDFPAAREGEQILLGVNEQRSWELAYLLACLCRAGFRLPSDREVWATGELGPDGRISASSQELDAKLQYLKTRLPAMVFYAPFDELPAGLHPDLEVRPVRSLIDLYHEVVRDAAGASRQAGTPEYEIVQHLQRILEHETKWAANCYVPLSGRVHLPGAEAVRRQTEGKYFPMAEAFPEWLESIDQALGLDVLRRFVLVGCGGSGKTRTLQHLWRAAALRAMNDPLAPMPIIVDLRLWDSAARDFSTFLYEEGIRKRLIPRFTPREPLYLVDSLERAGPESLYLIREAIESGDLARVVFTSRNRDFQRFGFELPVVVLDGLDRNRREAFVRNRLPGERGTRFLARIDELDLRRDDRRKLQRLLENPFLLEQLCMNEELLEGEGRLDATTGSSTLMQKFVECYFDRETRPPRRSEVSRQDLTEALGRIAVRVLGSSGNVITLVDARDTAEGRLTLGVLSLGEACRFIERNIRGDHLHFTHPLYQEFFAAQYLSENLGLLPNLVLPPVIRHQARINRLYDDMIPVMLDLLADPNSALEKIATIDPFIACDALARSESHSMITDTTRQAIVWELIIRLAEGGTDERELVTDYLAKFESLAVDSLREVISDDSADMGVRIAAVKVLGRMGVGKALEGLALTLCLPESKIRKTARRLLRELVDADYALMTEVIRERLTRLQKDMQSRVGELLAQCWGSRERDLVSLVGKHLGVDVSLHLAPQVAGEEGIAIMDWPEGEADETIPAADDPGAVADNVSWGLSWLAEWQLVPGDRVLEARASRWLRSAPLEHGSWTTVWFALWEANPGSPGLVERGLAWLAKRKLDHPSWPFLWTALNDFVHDDVYYERGQKWLEAHTTEHDSWSYVWLPLVKHDPDNRSLREGGQHWLATHEMEHPGAPVVWTGLWAATRNDATARAGLLTTGCLWLESAPVDHTGWGFVWPCLWHYCSRNRSAIRENAEILEFLDQRARELLREVDRGHSGWTYIWPRLFKEKRGDAELQHLGRRWLEINARFSPSNLSWSYVFQPLRRFCRSDNSLRELGKAWLAAAHVTHGSWPSVWGALMETDCARERISRPEGECTMSELGREWLGKCGMSHKSWGYVWHNVRLANRKSAEVSAELDIMGLDWIATADLAAKGWGYMLPHLLRGSHAKDMALRQRAMEWLRQASFSEGSWAWVWCALFSPRLSDTELQGLGRRWVEVSLDADRWASVWSNLWDAAPGDASLARLGRYWLGTVSPREVSRGQVWSRLALHQPWDADLQRGAWGILEGMASGNGRFDTKVWESLWACLTAPQDRERATQLLTEWLARSKWDFQWPFRWLQLHEMLPGYARLLEIGRTWVEATPVAARGWALVWYHVLEAAPEKEKGTLVALGTGWLEPEVYERTSWPLAWLTRWTHDPAARPNLIEHGKKWLTGHSSSSLQIRKAEMQVSARRMCAKLLVEARDADMEAWARDALELVGEGEAVEELRAALEGVTT